MKKILFTGAVLMALGVLLGAFGAHALKAQLSPEMLGVYKTAVEYQFYHSLGLLLVGLIGYHLQSKWLKWSGILLFVGVVLFCGSLYALSLTGIKTLGVITPFGGLSFVAGWICLAIAIEKPSDH
ncbi:MAG TPA: DUF423 domain-containing protein [Prolixibacteraceae bacterium]|jgi:uncharacterized membrane protein YgdD (TMEM256/DUF423 family)|nr:DUF423 domain-containing protein [Prolixibacteraceae bacterium]